MTVREQFNALIKGGGGECLIGNLVLRKIDTKNTNITRLEVRPINSDSRLIYSQTITIQFKEECGLIECLMPRESSMSDIKKLIDTVYYSFDRDMSSYEYFIHILKKQPVSLYTQKYTLTLAILKAIDGYIVVREGHRYFVEAKNEKKAAYEAVKRIEGLNDFEAKAYMWIEGE